MSAEIVSKPSRARFAARDSALDDLSELSAALRAHSAAVAEQFKSSDRRLGDFDRRFDKVEARLDRIAWAGWSIVGGMLVLLGKSFLPLLH